MPDVILYSSGIDSYLLDYYLTNVCRVDCKRVYFDINSRYSWAEKAMLKKQNKKVEIVECFDFSSIEQKDSFIPNRNLHLAMYATKWSNKIFIGGTASDRVSDNNKQIFDKLSKIISESLNKRITITSPFWDMYKCRLIMWYAKKNDKHNLLYNTFSCYNPLKKAQTVEFVGYSGYDMNKYHAGGERYLTHECMSCSACFRKAAALHILGIVLPFKNKAVIEHYQEEIVNNIELNERMRNTEQYLSSLGPLRKSFDWFEQQMMT